MAEAIPLITGVDGFEAVRNAIANILAVESTAQQALATGQGLDPDLWKLDVYTERTNPWELYRCEENAGVQLVNVWYPDSSIDKSSSNPRISQMMDTQINVDCMAYAETEETVTGQVCGDQKSFERSQRVAHLCRKMLMHPKYIQLGIPSIVSQRWMITRRSFQPTYNNVPVAGVAGVQLQFDIKHKEYIELETISDGEGAFVQIFREPDGKVFASMDIDWT